MFYIFLIISPIILFFLGKKFLILKYRNIRPTHIKNLLFLSQLPLYILILLCLIGYPKTILYTLLIFYIINNIFFQLLVHKKMKKYKENFLKNSKDIFQNSIANDK